MGETPRRGIRRALRQIFHSHGCSAITLLKGWDDLHLSGSDDRDGIFSLVSWGSCSQSNGGQGFGFSESVSGPTGRNGLEVRSTDSVDDLIDICQTVSSMRVEPGLFSALDLPVVE